MKVGFAFIEDFPVKFTATEAWACLRERWEEFHPAEAYHDAKVLSEAEFKKSFPNLPPLPPEAFESHR